MCCVDTRESQRLPGAEPFGEEEEHREPGLGTWVRRNIWLLVRLFITLAFSFCASLVVSQFSYGLEGDPEVLTVEQINSGQLPEGVERGDFVRITGTPAIPDDLEPTDLVGGPDSGIGISTRYSTFYFYWRLEETGDNLLIQSVESVPSVGGGEQVWEGKLERVGTVIFYQTTQEGLRLAGLPRDESIPVIEIGSTPEYYRQIFPAYTAILVLWAGSVGWFVWRRNKPFEGL